MARLGRSAGLELAPRFLERYLSGAGGHLQLSQQEALAFEPIRDAVAENIERFNERTFLEPRRFENLIAADVLDRITDLDDVDDIRLTDYYTYAFSKSSKSENPERYYGLLLSGEIDQFLASGQSKLQSLGQFNMRRVSARTEPGTEFWIEIEGSITHSWKDTYDFAAGFPFGDDALLLAKLRGAKPFTWRADWVTEHKGTMRIISREKREWVRKL